MSLDGHLWTIRPWLAHQLRPHQEPAFVRWSGVADDPVVGPVRFSGRFTARPAGRALLVIVHGLGGSCVAHYMIEAAAAAERAGFDVLRLNLRGADGEGEDLYNAGLTADLRAAIGDATLAAYETIAVLGFSMGGHIALRYATEEIDPRVRAVVAVCPPVDLDRTAEAIDRPSSWVYRRHVLESLKDMYASVAPRRPARARAARPLLPVAEARRLDRIRTWDDHVIAPRYGFRSAEHYYAEMSVAPRLHRLAVPALLLAVRADPMVPESTVRPALERRYPLLDTRWLDEGGHVGFPPALDLGFGGETGIYPQIFRWLQMTTNALR
jgi:predicted alpha/beta-fold hydrolase